MVSIYLSSISLCVLFVFVCLCDTARMIRFSHSNIFFFIIISLSLFFFLMSYRLCGDYVIVIIILCFRFNFFFFLLFIVIEYFNCVSGCVIRSLIYSFIYWCSLFFFYLFAVWFWMQNKLHKWGTWKN